MATIDIHFENMAEFIAFAAGKFRLSQEYEQRLTSIGAIMEKPVEKAVMPTPPVQTPEAPAEEKTEAPTVATVPTIPTVATVATVPTTPTPRITIDDLLKGAQFFLDHGKTADLKELLDKFQVQRVSNLKPDQLDAFAEAMRAKGASV